MGGGFEWVGAPYGVHRGAEGGSSACDGRVYRYAYRLYPPGDSSFERCISIAWCTICREFSTGLVFVSRETALWDALAGLDEWDRERLARGSRKLRDHLDGLVRRGLWPPEAPAPPAEPKRPPRRPSRRRGRPYPPPDLDND